jgi:hypothetical protein
MHLSPMSNNSTSKLNPLFNSLQFFSKISFILEFLLALVHCVASKATTSPSRRLNAPRLARRHRSLCGNTAMCRTVPRSRFKPRPLSCAPLAPAPCRPAVVARPGRACLRTVAAPVSSDRRLSMPLRCVSLSPVWSSIRASVPTSTSSSRVTSPRCTISPPASPPHSRRRRPMPHACRCCGGHCGVAAIGCRCAVRRRV